MRIPCPLCGDRDRREFYYMGAAEALTAPPGPEAPPEVIDDQLHLRTNPAGETRDVWYHETGCGAWLIVTRDTVTHAVHGAVLAERRGTTA
jgi:sarcosine oxidase subunit delta